MSMLIKKQKCLHCLNRPGSRAKHKNRLFRSAMKQSHSSWKTCSQLYSSTASRCREMEIVHVGVTKLREVIQEQSLQPTSGRPQNNASQISEIQPTTAGPRCEAPSPVGLAAPEQTPSQSQGDVVTHCRPCCYVSEQYLFFLHRKYGRNSCMCNRYYSQNELVRRIKDLFN